MLCRKSFMKISKWIISPGFAARIRGMRLSGHFYTQSTSLLQCLKNLT